MLLRCIGERFTCTVCFIHHDRIGQLEYAFFYALQLITTAGQHQKQKKIDHPGDLMLRLPDPDCFNQNDVKTCRLAEHQ